MVEDVEVLVLDELGLLLLEFNRVVAWDDVIRN